MSLGQFDPLWLLPLGCHVIHKCPHDPLTPRAWSKVKAMPTTPSKHTPYAPMSGLVNKWGEWELAPKTKSPFHVYTPLDTRPRGGLPPWESPQWVTRV